MSSIEGVVGLTTASSTEPEQENAVSKKSTTSVRTANRPFEAIEVGAAEFLDLTRQGLVYSHEDVEGLKSPNKWVAPTTSEKVETTSGVITDAPTEGEGGK